MRRIIHALRSCVLLAIGVGVLGCGESAQTPAPKEDFGATPEEGLRAALDIDGPTLKWVAKLDNGDEAFVYVPNVAAADRAKFADRFPVVVLLQGALVPKAQYDEYANAVAGYGFVVVVPEHLRAVPPMFPDPVPLTEASVIPSALARVEALDADKTTPFYQVTDTQRSALVGHSQGGITSLLALAGQCLPGICAEPFTLPASISAGALFGTHSVQMGSATPVDTTGHSVALLQGSLDGRALPENAALTYETLAPTRGLITFEGLNHFGINDDSVIPGTIEDPTMQTVDQALGINRLAVWTALWFHAHFDDAPVAKHWLFDVAGSNDGQVSVKSDQAP